MTEFQLGCRQICEHLKTLQFPFNGQRRLAIESVSKSHRKEVSSRTMYLSWTQLYNMMRKTVSDFQPEDGFALYLPNEIFDPQVLMFCSTWDLWHQKSGWKIVSELTSENLTEVRHLVLFDIWALSGEVLLDDIEQIQTTSFRGMVTICVAWISSKAIANLYQNGSNDRFSIGIRNSDQSGNGNCRIGTLELLYMDIPLIYTDLEICNQRVVERFLRCHPQPFDLIQELSPFLESRVPVKQSIIEWFLPHTSHVLEQENLTLNLAKD